MEVETQNADLAFSEWATVFWVWLDVLIKQLFFSIQLRNHEEVEVLELEYRDENDEGAMKATQQATYDSDEIKHVVNLSINELHFVAYLNL